LADVAKRQKLIESSETVKRFLTSAKIRKTDSVLLKCKQPWLWCWRFPLPFFDL